MAASAQSGYEGIPESFGCSATGGAGFQSILEVHRLLSADIEGREIRQFVSYYDLSNEDLARLLGIKKRTLQRREKRALGCCRRLDMIPTRPKPVTRRLATCSGGSSEASGANPWVCGAWYSRPVPTMPFPGREHDDSVAPGLHSDRGAVYTSMVAMAIPLMAGADIPSPAPCAVHTPTGTCPVMTLGVVASSRVIPLASSTRDKDPPGVLDGPLRGEHLKRIRDSAS